MTTTLTADELSALLSVLSRVEGRGQHNSGVLPETWQAFRNAQDKLDSIGDELMGEGECVLSTSPQVVPGVED